MPNYYQKATVQPDVPISDITPIELCILQMMFDSELVVDEAGRRYYFFAEEAINQMGDVSLADFKAAFDASPVDSGRAWIFARDLLAGLSSDEVELELDFDRLNYAEMFQDIVKRSSLLNHIQISVSFLCNRMLPDGFGGAAEFITADEISYFSTNDFISSKLALLEAGGIEEAQNYHGIGVHVKPRPIDTARRDGSRIMIFDGEKQLWGFGSWAPGEDIDGPFTHWMPSPQPPLENMG